ncbi:HNH endonuclease signature motif containing protein [Clostridium sp.]|uniref:HNH endonuclease signature motif containing protein n=1 Tax=Clostridium sp. TaxID=1506 RepID=UPI001A4BD522|nr:HNH endonuclease signature motif containing protein [Clostridium sp.]MBK5239856.1 HNH endonuclease [Clostridium sp.]
MIEYIGVGKIPIRNYLVIMDRRCYSPKLAIEYTKDIYGIDISKEIKNAKTMWDYSKNVYKSFDERFPPRYLDDGTREFFNSVGRARYYKFYGKFKENDGFWDLIIDWCSKGDVVHHIYPLTFGGNSSLMNLIPITDFNHKLLHENSVEKKRECCFMAVDYLSYLYSFDSLKYLNEKYNILQYKDMPGEFKHNFLNTIFETEMRLFYKDLEIEHPNN